MKFILLELRFLSSIFGFTSIFESLLEIFDSIFTLKIASVSQLKAENFKEISEALVN